MNTTIGMYLEQIEGNVVVHRYESVAVQLGEVRNRENDSVEFRLVLVHVYPSVSSESQTIYNGVIHVTYLDRHLKIDDRNSRIDHCKQGSVQAAGQLASICTNDCTVNRNLGLRIDGGDNNVLETPGNS